MSAGKKVSIVIPCYYNQDNIPLTTQKLLEVEPQFGEGVTVEYILVDDGSKDATWDRILEFKKQHPSRVTAVKLTRNFGTHNSALAGLKYATGDFIGFLAADLQDPPELIPKMFEHWCKGTKLVLANRMNREDTLVTKLISGAFHLFMEKVALPNSPSGGFDLWFFDKELKDKVVELNEKNTHISYLFIWLGYNYVNIPYVRKKREVGTSKWSFWKRVKAMLDSVISFSYLPVRMISTMGIVMGLSALVYCAVVIYAAIESQVKVEGWASLMVVVLVVSSFQMIALGILGEYSWRILDNSRSRPNYVVDRVEK